ncbi:helix-turn-helix domain-containing protein [Thermogemmatispora tikiterensis]|uniref:HTH cro/C1-type domain-containing protein n=1 Tax=Thermogemmatispora tikiterensis TaxID=1825093 RepID=A0A328VNK9_9CHLR|nr:helix-turn-helix domain-containing protein [Thermogemmatispora tikiterensis]RAQ97722.1 hypothetical protein A4R35_19440 [Thermogemmatispora tikiterensis]
MLPKNTFGHLIRTYRRLRGWSQADLAQRWGYSREYVSQIERGQRKLDSLQQVLRLADLLGIPQDQLDAIGRGIPRRSIPIQRPEQADSAILQMLLAPSRDMVQLSYLLWIADQAPSLEDKLHDLVSQLDQALISYHGDLLKPAQQLLAYAHQMLGRMAVDRLDLAAAAGHFSEAVALGEELRDPDLLTIGMVYQGSLLRKRGRFSTAIRCFEAAHQYLQGASTATQGMYYVNFSTVYADSGQHEPFLRCIDQALDLATTHKESIAGLANDFSLDDVLWAKAGGLAELWKPAEALKIYEQTDKLRPFRPLRELGAYLIDKGEAFLRLGELDEGISLSLKGIELATSYQSRRQLGWIEKTYQRLRVLPIGKDKRLDTLKDALSEARKKLE